MYIIAMWLQSPRGGEQGVNVVIHKHANGLAHGGDLKKIMKDPGGDKIEYLELRPGGNRVQAELHLVLDDKDYDRDAVLGALRKFEREKLNTFMLGPLEINEPLERGRMRGLFETYLGPMSPRSTQTIFSLLTSTIDKALRKYHGQIAA